MGARTPDFINPQLRTLSDEVDRLGRLTGGNGILLDNGPTGVSLRHAVPESRATRNRTVVVIAEPDESVTLRVQQVAYVDHAAKMELVGLPFEAYPYYGTTVEDYSDKVWNPNDELSSETQFLGVQKEYGKWVLQLVSGGSGLPPHSGIHLLGAYEYKQPGSPAPDYDFIHELDPETLTPIEPRRFVWPPDRRPKGCGGDKDVCWLLGYKELTGIYKLDARTMRLLKWRYIDEVTQYMSIGGGKDGAWLSYRIPNTNRLEICWVHPETLAIQLRFPLNWATCGATDSVFVGGEGSVQGVIWVAPQPDTADHGAVIYKCTALTGAIEYTSWHPLPSNMRSTCGGVGGDREDVFFADRDSTWNGTQGIWARFSAHGNSGQQLPLKSLNSFGGIYPLDIGGGGL